MPYLFIKISLKVDLLSTTISTGVTLSSDFKQDTCILELLTIFNAMKK